MDGSANSCHNNKRVEHVHGFRTEAAGWHLTVESTDTDPYQSKRYEVQKSD